MCDLGGVNIARRSGVKVRRRLTDKQRFACFGARYNPTKTGLFGDGGPYYLVGRAISDAFAANSGSVLSAQKLKALKDIVVDVGNIAKQHKLSFDAKKVIDDLDESYRAYAGLRSDRRSAACVLSLADLARVWDEVARGMHRRAFKPSVGAKALLKDSGGVLGSNVKLRELRDLDVWRQFLSHHTYQQMVEGRHEIAVVRSRLIEELILLGRDEVAGNDAIWTHQLDGLLVTNAYLAHRMGRPVDEAHYLFQMRRRLRPDSNFLRLGLSRHMFYRCPTHPSVDGAIAMVSGGKQVSSPGMTFADGGILAYAAISQLLRGIRLVGRSGDEVGSPSRLLEEAAERQARIGDTEGSVRFRVLLAQGLVRENEFDGAAKALGELELEIDKSPVEMVHAMALVKEGWAYWNLTRHKHNVELAVTSATSHMNNARRLARKAGLSTVSSNYLVDMEREIRGLTRGHAIGC